MASDIDGSSEWGSFPFGQPNTARGPRIAAQPCEAVVIGVYPSAFHVTWTAPSFTAGPGRKGRVAAMAVDVEPTVFWDGADDDFTARRDTWMRAVEFVEGDEPGQHGYISATSPATNGSSGAKVNDLYLAPLAIDPAAVTFTDVYPVFMTKPGSKKRRGQRDAIRDEFDNIADQLGRDRSTLPERISNAALPAAAASRFGSELATDLATTAAPLVITLGDEVWATLAAIPEITINPPVPHFVDLYGTNYGRRGTIQVGPYEAEWLPLVHPGLLRTTSEPATAPPNGSSPRTVDGWNELHRVWAMRSPK